jgi:hypothetical protein
VLRRHALTILEETSSKPPRFWRQWLCSGDSCAENIYGITYHISSSPYYSEDIHTNYPRMSLKGVITQGLFRLKYVELVKTQIRDFI